MVDKNTLNRVAQLEAASPAYQEPPRITPDMTPEQATRIYKQLLNWPSPPAAPLTSEQQARQREQEADPDYPELCTRVYRLSFDHDLTGDQLFELAKEQLIAERAAQAAAAAERAEAEQQAEQEATRIYRESLLEEPADDNPLAGLSAEEATQRYRELLDEPAPVADQQQQEAALDEPKPEPTPQTVAVPQNDDDNSWVLM